MGSYILVGVFGATIILIIQFIFIAWFRPQKQMIDTWCWKLFDSLCDKEIQEKNVK